MMPLAHPSMATSDEVRTDVLLPVDRLYEEVAEVVQGEGGDQGEHSILVGDLCGWRGRERGETHRERIRL